MIEALHDRSRYFVLVVVAGSLLAAPCLLVHGAAESISLIDDTGRTASVGAQSLAFAFIGIVDRFLLGTVFLVSQGATWDGEREIPGFGAAIALVIAALTFALAAAKKTADATDGIAPAE